MTTHCDPTLTAALVRAGDPAALERIACCYGDHLRSVGRCVCSSPQEAEDAVQDALLAAGENLERFRGEGSVVAWVSRMVANACHARRRGRKNNPALHIDPDTAALLSPSDPESEAARAQLAATLSAALATLSGTDQRIVLLAEVEGWTGREVAAALSMTPEAVRARLCRARRKLRSALAD